LRLGKPRSIVSIGLRSYEVTFSLGSMRTKGELTQEETSSSADCWIVSFVMSSSSRDCFLPRSVSRASGTIPPQ